MCLQNEEEEAIKAFKINVVVYEGTCTADKEFERTLKSFHKQITWNIPTDVEKKNS